MSFKFAQLQSQTLAGSGCAIGATSITLSSFVDIDGNLVTMSTYFGTIGYATLEPNNSSQEEQISFTGITQNSNSTATLTGVKTVLFYSPYTETSGTAKSHPGGATFVITNTAAFYNQVATKQDDETITGTWTFPNGAATPRLGSSYVAPTLQYQVASKGYVDSVAIGGAANASTGIQGLVQLPTQAQVDAKTATGSTGAALSVTPDLQRSTLLSDYVADTGSANTYAIAPSPAITAYTTGQRFSWKAATANTGASTLNVNALGAKSIKKNGTLALTASDIIAGIILETEYDGTNFQMITPTGNSKITINSAEIYGVDSVGTDAYAVTLSPVPTQYSAGMVVNFTAGTANTSGATLNVNGLGAKAIVKGVSTALATGDILSGQTVTCVYDGTNFVANIPTSKSTSGVSAGPASSSTQIITHNLGRVPNIIRLDGLGTMVVNASGGNYSSSHGTYNASNNVCVYINGTVGSATQPATSTSFAIYLNKTSATTGDATGVVGNVTATTFDIVWTASADISSATSFMWEAQ